MLDSMQTLDQASNASMPTRRSVFVRPNLTTLATRSRWITVFMPQLHSSTKAGLTYPSFYWTVNDVLEFSTNTYEKLGLSPGTYTVAYADQCQKRRLKKQERQRLPSIKRRRLVLKQERATNQGAMEALEGSSYQSGVGHSDVVDIEVLPDAVPRGKFSPVEVANGTPTFITIDLETTDLIRGSVMPHITQVAAHVVGSGSGFSTYVQPKLPISAEAQKVTGIAVDIQNNVCVKGKPVTAVPIKQAISDLGKWLERFSNVFLVAHNGRRFDFPVLMTAVEKTKEKDGFLKCVTGLIDSLPIFKKLYPNRSHKQEDLVKLLIGKTYDAHNAEADVQALGDLVDLVEHSTLLSSSFAPIAIIQNMHFNANKCFNMRSLDPLLSKGIIKRPTAENIAGSGLNIRYLEVIYKRSGEDGLRDTFVSKNSENQPRVTSSGKVLEEVIPKLAKYFADS